MELINPDAEKYALSYTTTLDEILKDDLHITQQTHEHAHMHSGALQGKILESISRMIKPMHILEIGSFTGFSALCLEKGMQEGGQLTTIELRPDDAAKAEVLFHKAGKEHRIKMITGDARLIIPTLTVTFNLVFIDADKLSYIDYYELTLPKLQDGGWILADNVLFHGQVLDHPVKGKNAKAIQAFNEHVANDSRVEQVMLTVRDGLMLIRKK
jgi:predicted O-methyltransferase YrrM